MDNYTAIKNELVFGLDIGTRNVVGVVGYQTHNRFKVVAMALKEHDTRAMLDGQIHDIYKVAQTIRMVKNELEHIIGFPLKNVCIAAAGRVLKTCVTSADYSFEEETRVTSEDIYTLNLIAVERAHQEINKNSSNHKYYCVGYSPLKYTLNGYEISNLEGHKANSIYVQLIATFLPDEVVDGLYEAVEGAGLLVESLTLEPIAAMNVAIPEKYRLLNISLVDVGAGTSDICITKDGCITAYGMIPLAGDEITEAIAKKHLVDFNTAESIKIQANTNNTNDIEYEDVLGLPETVSPQDIQTEIEPLIDNMAKKVSERIIKLNGGKPVNAVFVVGGGGKLIGFTDKLANYLNIPEKRVALRGKEVLTEVDFDIDNFEKDSLYVTPVGICTNYYTQKNNFVFVTVNGERIKLYDNTHLTVLDAVMQYGYPNDSLFPKRGKELNYTINGVSYMARGEAGDGAEILLDGAVAGLNTPIEKNASITIKASTAGKPAEITLRELKGYKHNLRFNVNNKLINCPRFAYVNGELQSEFYSLKDNDSVVFEDYYTVTQLLTFMDIDINNSEIYVNNEKATKDSLVYENFKVTIDSKESAFNETAQDEAYATLKTTPEVTPKVIPKASSQDFERNSVKDEASLQADNTLGIHDIFITVNNSPVKLTGKDKYILVDLFLFYDFDLSKPKGNIVIKQNGLETQYTAPLNDGDKIELYWEAN